MGEAPINLWIEDTLARDPSKITLLRRNKGLVSQILVRNPPP